MERQHAEEEAEAAANEAKMDAGETLFGDAPEKADVEHNLNDPLDGLNTRWGLIKFYGPPPPPPCLLYL
jgi:hypothetical protein